MKKAFLIILFLCSFIAYAQPTINGDLSDSDYSTVATKGNINSGFGPNIDIQKIVYYPDATNNILYFGVEGKLNTGTNDGIGIWIDIEGSSSPDGADAGSNLGSISGAGHYMEDGANPNFKADFEVDYMFAINLGSSPINCYINAAERIGPAAGVYLGNCGQSGSSFDYSTNGTVFANGHTITFAFDNAGTFNKGFEIKIPFGAIDATSAMTIKFFAFVVSNTAYFSDVTIPGNITSGNPGFNANFFSMSSSSGPFHTPSQNLPVELTSFTASLNRNNVTLNWSTATEINNYGFEIERKSSNEVWKKIGFVQGFGTSNSTKNYNYLDDGLRDGLYSYRLKQIDNDASVSYSKEIEVEIKALNTFSLEQNHPNPFNPSTIIKWQSPVDAWHTLKVYNVIGKEVATLVNEFRESGYYDYAFNASELPSGVYLYKLQIGDFVQTKKMILMR